MQHKPRLFCVKNLILFIAVLGVAGLVRLMMVDIPVSQKPIEKELDAKAFIEQK